MRTVSDGIQVSGEERGHKGSVDMYLSKSIYVSVWSCPKGTWISKYHPKWVVPQEE